MSWRNGKAAKDRVCCMRYICNESGFWEGQGMTDRCESGPTLPKCMMPDLKGDGEGGRLFGFIDRREIMDEIMDNG